MLYVSNVTSTAVRITDSEDGVTETVTREKLPLVLKQLKSLGVVVHGISSSGIKEYTQEDRMKAWLARADMLGVLGNYVFADGYEVLKTYIGPGGKVRIPPVKHIGHQCFYYNDNKLDEVFIPDTVKSIGKKAFSHPDYRSIGVVHFKYGIKDIGTDCFERVTLESDLVLPDSVRYIRSGCFMDSVAKKIVVPDDCTVESHAFCRCNAENIVLDGREILCCEAAFYWAKGLKTIDLYSKCVKQDAFRESDVEEVTLRGPGRGKIGFTSMVYSSAFFWCSSLRKVDCIEGIDYFGDYAFASCHSLLNIRVPRGTSCINEQSTGFYNLGQSSWKEKQAGVDYTIEVPKEFYRSDDVVPKYIEDRRVILY